MCVNSDVRQLIPRRSPRVPPRLPGPAAPRYDRYDAGGWGTVAANARGIDVIRFPNLKSTGVISVKRMDAGEVMVGYEVS